MVEQFNCYYEPREDDYFEVAAAHQRYRLRRPVFRLALLLYFGLMILLTVLIVEIWLIKPGSVRDVSEAGWWRVVAIVGGLWSILYFFRSRNFLNRIYFRQLFRARPAGVRRIEWGFDEVKLWSRNDLSESTFYWELYETIVESPKCFLFYQASDILTLTLPEHGFSSPHTLRRFIETARARVPNYVVLGVCRLSAKPDPLGLDVEI